MTGVFIHLKRFRLDFFSRACDFLVLHSILSHFVTLDLKMVYLKRLKFTNVFLNN